MTTTDTPNWAGTDFFVWVGTCQEDGHNKIYGIVRTDSDYCTFWGAIGTQKYSFKKLGIDGAMKKYREKSRKYATIAPEDVSRVYPEFNDSFDNNFVMAKMLGTITSYANGQYR